MRRLIPPTGSSVHYLPTANATIRIPAPTILDSSAPFPLAVPVVSSYKYFNTAATAPRHRHKRNFLPSITNSHSVPRSTYSILLNSTPSLLQIKSIHRNFATMASATNFFDFKVPNSKLPSDLYYWNVLNCTCMRVPTASPSVRTSCLVCLAQHWL